MTKCLCMCACVHVCACVCVCAHVCTVVEIGFVVEEIPVTSDDFFANVCVELITAFAPIRRPIDFRLQCPFSGKLTALHAVASYCCYCCYFVLLLCHQQTK